MKDSIKRLLVMVKPYLIFILCLPGFSAGILIENSTFSLIYLSAWLVASFFILKPYLRERRNKNLFKQQNLKNLKLENDRKLSELKLEKNLGKQELENQHNEESSAGFLNILGAILIIGLPIVLVIWLLTALIGVFGLILGVIIFILLIGR